MAKTNSFNTVDNYELTWENVKRTPDVASAAIFISLKDMPTRQKPGCFYFLAGVLLPLQFPADGSLSPEENISPSLLATDSACICKSAGVLNGSSPLAGGDDRQRSFRQCGFNFIYSFYWVSFLGLKSYWTWYTLLRVLLLQIWAWLARMCFLWTLPPNHFSYLLAILPFPCTHTLIFQPVFNFFLFGKNGFPVTPSISKESAGFVFHFYLKYALWPIPLLPFNSSYWTLFFRFGVFLGFLFGLVSVLKSTCAHFALVHFLFNKLFVFNIIFLLIRQFLYSIFKLTIVFSLLHFILYIS